MLNIDPPGISTAQIAHEFFEGWWVLPRICLQDTEQLLHFAFQSRGRELLRVFLGLPCVVERPSHHSNLVAVSSRGSCMPSMMDSRMPGTERRCSVSVIAFQSLSASRTALPRLPVITTGSWLSDVSSISL